MVSDTIPPDNTYNYDETNLTDDPVGVEPYIQNVLPTQKN